MCCSWLRTDQAISVILSVTFVLLLLLILNLLRVRSLRRRRRNTVDVDLLDFIIDLIAEQNGDEDRPLDRAILATLPKSRYCRDGSSGEAPPDCVVCLSQFEEGEMVRTLPNCDHIFHADCIDMWLYSHSKCPVCRAPVEPLPPSDPSVPDPDESGPEAENENDHGRRRSSSRCSSERNSNHCVLVVEDGDGRSK